MQRSASRPRATPVSVMGGQHSHGPRARSDEASGSATLSFGHRSRRHVMTDELPLEQQVLHRIDGGVSWITLNRPEAQNAITPDQRNRIIDLLAAASEDLAVRAVVL